MISITHSSAAGCLICGARLFNQLNVGQLVMKPQQSLHFCTGFRGPRSSSSFSCTCMCITNHSFSLTDTAASASAILLQLLYSCDQTHLLHNACGQTTHATSLTSHISCQCAHQVSQHTKSVFVCSQCLRRKPCYLPGSGHCLTKSVKSWVETHSACDAVTMANIAKCVWSMNLTTAQHRHRSDRTNQPVHSQQQPAAVAVAQSWQALQHYQAGQHIRNRLGATPWLSRKGQPAARAK
jgi:hypothetical protein